MQASGPVTSSSNGVPSGNDAADSTFTGDDDDVRLLAWNRRVLPWVVIAALAPFIGFSRSDGGYPWIVIVIDVLSWLVFLVDLVIRRRLVPKYLSSFWGRIDLAIVVATFPWFLFVPGAGRWIVVFRIARLVRLLVLAANLPSAKVLIKRLDRLAVGSLLLLLGCSYVALVSDGPADNFDNFGDALWWGIVTMTTTGYGDIIPDTTVGRIAATVLMLGGLLLLGALAAIVASFLAAGDRATEAARTGVPAGASLSDPQDPGLQQELTAVRNELAALRHLIEASGGQQASETDRPSTSS